MTSISTLQNGLTVIVEEIDYLESVAYNLYIPGGILRDSEEFVGSSLLLTELSSRGAGDFDSRALSEEFDAYGIRHSESAAFDRFAYRGALLAEHFDKALSLSALMIRKPQLPEEEVENIRQLLLQEIASVDDNPSRKAMVEFSKRYYPGVYGRASHGSVDGIKACTVEQLRKEWEQRYKPGGAVLSVAGNISKAQVIEAAEAAFSDWQGDTEPRPKFENPNTGQSHYVSADSAQQQIVIAYPSAKFGDPHYYTAKVATGVLSGGMFGRLFIEVREKRGLCYQVYARHTSSENYGTVVAFSGTTPERADETLAVMLEEIKRIKGTVTEEELDRVKANLLSQLIISEESTSARATSNAGDWWVSKRVRSLDEVKEEILKVSASDIDEYCEQFPVDAATVLTLGARELGTEEVRV